MSGTRFFALSCFYALYGLGQLGPWGSFKLILARHFAGEWKIRPRGFKAPLHLRGKTSDATLLYCIFLKREYRLPSQAPEFMIDAGANIGMAAIFFARHYPELKIVAIEPEDGNFAMLQKNTAAYPNIDCVQAGVWSESTRLRIADDSKEKWGFQVVPDPQGPIQAIGLPELLERRHAPELRTLVKIDVEGSDQAIFAADTAWLNTVHDLYVEVHGSWRELFKALERYEYDAHLSYENIVFELDHTRVPAGAEASLSNVAG